jgi:hypothetical protein
VYTWTAATRDLQKLETDFRVRQEQQEQQQLLAEVMACCLQEAGTAVGLSSTAQQ